MNDKLIVIIQELEGRLKLLNEIYQPFDENADFQLGEIKANQDILKILKSHL